MYRIANSTRSPRGLRAAILGGVFAILLGTGATAQITGAFELRPGVVIDPGVGTIYLMSRGGGIDAVDLTTGNVRWHSDVAGRPIAAAATGILALAEGKEPGTLSVVLLDRTGRQVRTGAFALPEGFEAPVVDGLSHRLVVRGDSLDGGRSFVVAWQSTFLPPRGALILDETAIPRAQTGAFSFDSATGAIRAAPVDIGAAAELLAFRDVQVPQSQLLPVPGQQYLSSNGSYRLASVPSAGAAVEAYDWTVFDPQGFPLGTFSSRLAYTPFHVAGGLLVYEGRPGAWLENGRMIEQPLSLRAVALASGVEQWSHPIRNLEYQGPFPP